MGIIDKMFKGKRKGSVNKLQDYDSYSGYTSYSGYGVGGTTRADSIVHICEHIIISTLNSLDKTITDDNVRKLYAQPTPYSNSYNLLESIVHNVLYNGNCIIWVIRDVYKNPIELRVIDHDKHTHYKSRQGDLLYKIRDAEITRDGDTILADIVVTADDILDLRLMTNDDGVTGKSILSPLYDDISLISRINLKLKTAVRVGASINGMLKYTSGGYQGAYDDIAKKREYYKAETDGFARMLDSGSVAYLEQGAEFTEYKNQLNIGDILNIQKHTISRITSLMQLSPEHVGLELTNSSTEEMNKQLVRAIKTWTAMLNAELESKLGATITYDYSVLDGSKTDSDKYKLDLYSKGVISRAELRSVLGYTADYVDDDAEIIEKES